MAFGLGGACTQPTAEPTQPPSGAAAGVATRPKPGALVRVDDDRYGRFAKAPDAPGIGDQAPRFLLPTSDGGEVVLDDLLAEGKPVVVVFYRGFW
jgi:hypothetical protein